MIFQLDMVIKEFKCGGLKMVMHESDRAKSKGKRESPGRIWPDWYPVLATFRNSDNRKATWQLINTIVPYCGLWYLQKMVAFP